MKKFIFLGLLLGVFVFEVIKAEKLQKKSLQASTRSMLVKKGAVSFAEVVAVGIGFSFAVGLLARGYEELSQRSLENYCDRVADYFLFVSVPLGVFFGCNTMRRAYQGSFECYFNTAIDLLEELKSNVFFKQITKSEDFLQGNGYCATMALQVVCAQLQGLLDQIETSCNVLCDMQYEDDLLDSDDEDIELVVHELQIWKNKIAQWLISAQKYLDEEQGD